MAFVRTLLLLCLLAAPLSAQLRPDGPVIRVGEAGWDTLAFPDVAVAPSGDFLVAWAFFDDDVLDAAIVSRLYRRHGIPATETPLRIDVEPDPLYPVQIFPKLAPRAGGGFAVLWSNADRVPCLGICDPPLGTDYLAMSARFLTPGGAPQGDPVPIGGGETAEYPRFVLDFPSGETLFLWTGWKPSFWTTSAHRFNADGKPLAEPFEVASGDPQDRVLGAAALPDGGFLVLWARLNSAVVRRYSPSGELVGPEISIDPKTSYLQDAEIAAQGDGSFAVAWTRNGSGPHKVFLRLFGPAAPAGEIQVSPPSAHFHRLEALEADGAGNVAVLWNSLNSLYLQLYGPNGAAKGAPLRVDDIGRFGIYDPTLATNGRGDWVLAWTEISDTRPGFEILAQPFLEECAPSPTRVCLADGRFRAEVSWKDHAENHGKGQALKLTEDTGAFWFFGKDNLELVVKVLDGRSFNGHFWVFSSALTDVEHDLTVRDMLTGDEVVYHNPAGKMGSRADILAFPKIGTSPPGESRPPNLPNIARPAHPPTVCAAGEDVLCLQGGRFRAEVEFVDPRTGATRRAQSLPLSGESGAFWFFDPENVELFVKVLDGRALNGHFWVFHGALSDVEYTLTISDESDGHKVWTYHNPRGRLHSGADTRAF